MLSTKILSNHQKYLNLLNNLDKKLILSIGPAGTGKTLMACENAIKQLKENKFRKITITRPTIGVDEELGYLPGSFEDKMAPWLRPIFDVFYEHYTKPIVEKMVKNDIIEISPLAYMRGRTFKNTYIIADEMQNSTLNQFKMLVTRIGDNSRMVITGDVEQIDNNIESGLVNFIGIIDKIKLMESIGDVRFEISDIKRSDIVKDILNVYSMEKN